MKTPHPLPNITKRIEGCLSLPGDKSMSHRALLFNSLAQGEATVTGLSLGADVLSTAECLRRLGCEIELSGTTAEITSSGTFISPQQVLDCGNSGTTTRLLCGFLAGSGLTLELTGDASLSKRPMRRVLDPLTAMGAHFECQDYKLPLSIRPPKAGQLSGIDYTLPMASAQVKSAVLLAGLWTAPEATVIVREALPTRDHTERMLTAMGCEIRQQDGVIQLIGRKNDIRSTDIAVPGDISSAAFLMVATAILPGSSLILENVGLNPTRTPLLKLLKTLGITVDITLESESVGEAIGTVRLQAPDRLQGNINICAEDVPLLIDELPIITILGLFTDGRLTIQGAEELRHKESDRLQSMIDIVTVCGVDVEASPDGLSFQGNSQWTIPSSVYDHLFMTHHDHRLVMSLEILGLRGTTPLKIDGKEWVNISYPSFYEHLKMLLKPSH